MSNCKECDTLTDNEICNSCERDDYIERLERFADEVISGALSGMDFEGADIQGVALDSYLIIEKKMEKLCAEDCTCSEVYGEGEDFYCLRKNYGQFRHNNSPAKEGIEEIFPGTMDQLNNLTKRK